MTELLQGLVLVSYGSHGVIRTDSGATLDCQYRRQVGRPFCGDRVVVQPLSKSSGVVEEILPRVNRFVRADSQQRPQIVAANLDRVLVVLARRPLPSQDLVERYLVAVHSLGIEPVIVMNKVDLPVPEDSTERLAVLDHVDDYRQLGYTVLATSCKGPPGIGALRPVGRRWR